MFPGVGLKMTKTTKSKFPASVIRVMSDDRLVFNRGSEDGIQEGQRFLVYALGDELFDPGTGDSLGRLEIVRGTGVAMHVQEHLTTVDSDKRLPASKRTFRRTDPFHSLIAGSSEEVVHEVGERLPFDEASEGDLVKPL